MKRLLLVYFGLLMLACCAQSSDRGIEYNPSKTQPSGEVVHKTDNCTYFRVTPKGSGHYMYACECRHGFSCAVSTY